MPLPERVVEDGFQLYQALFGPARQMQSYYGSSPAAKRFEVTLCERELQLPEGVVRAWNGEVLRWGHGSATGRVLSRGRPGRLARWYEDKKDQEFPAPAARVWIRAAHESGGILFWGPPQSSERVATRYSLADAASQKSTQCLGHIQCRGLLTSFAAGILLDFSFSHASGGCRRLVLGRDLIQYLHGPCPALPDVWIVERIEPELRISQRGRNLPFEVARPLIPRGRS